MREQSDQLQVGFIGMGNIARTHLEHARQMESVGIAAICDTDLDRAEQAAGTVGGRAYLDWREMLERETLDALLVCIPQFARGDEVKEAAGRGINLFVEKPAAADLDRARDNAAAIEQAGVINAIGYMWRSSTCIAEMRRLIAGRPVGLIHGYAISNVEHGSWFWDKAKSGGQIFDQTTHLIDLARLFGGEVAALSAMGTVGRTVSGDWVKTEDVGGLLMRFANGTIATFANTWASEAGPDSRFSLSVFGNRFSLDFDPLANRLTGIVDGEPIDFHGSEEPYTQELVNFFAAVRSGRQQLIRSPYSEGVGTLEVTLAANRAMETGGEVKL